MYLNLVPAQQRQPAHKLPMPGWVNAGECSKKWPKSGLLWPRPNPNPSHYPNPILQKAFTDPKWSSTPYQHHQEPLAIERLIWSCIASRYHYIARIASSTNLSPLSDFWYLSPIKSGLVRAMKLKKNRTNLIVLPLKFIFFCEKTFTFPVDQHVDALLLWNMQNYAWAASTKGVRFGHLTLALGNISIYKQEYIILHNVYIT